MGSRRYLLLGPLWAVNGLRRRFELFPGWPDLRKGRCPLQYGSFSAIERWSSGNNEREAFAALATLDALNLKLHLKRSDLGT
jgi:hypothetical protein